MTIIIIINDINNSNNSIINDINNNINKINNNNKINY